MKHIALLTVAAVLALLQFTSPTRSNAQGGETILLNDTTPTIDAVISLPPDSTGVISLSLHSVHVKVTDGSGALVFESADPRVRALELSIAANTGVHTLTLERLPGISLASVQIASLAELTAGGAVTMVSSSALTVNQGYLMPLTLATPGGTISFVSPTEIPALITATFGGIAATAQFVDKAGLVVATSYRDIDGVSIVLEGGDYALTLLAGGLTQDTQAGVQIVPAENAGFALLPAPTDQPAESAACNAVVSVLSANLRSGPGTGYSVLGYAPRGETLPVGGRNTENNWVVVGRPDGTTAWLAQSVSQLDGNCESLTVFDIPLRNAQPVTVQIIPPASNSGQPSGQPSGEHHDDDDDHGGDDHGGDDD